MQKRKRSVLVAGGDLRQLSAAEALQAAGYAVAVVGFSADRIPENLAKQENLALLEDVAAAAAQEPAGYEVLLLPVRFDAERPGGIPAPFGTVPLTCAALTALVQPETGWVLGGQDAPAIASVYHYINYMQMESLAQANAVLTVEAAMARALQETGRSLWRSRVLVTGSGRIGTLLALRLKAMGAAVTVAARRSSERMRLETCGIEKTLPLPLLPEALCGYDLIYNTIPAPVFQRTHLEHVSLTGIVLDLASAPYGCLEHSDKNLPCRYVCASGLPADAGG